MKGKGVESLYWIKGVMDLWSIEFLELNFIDPLPHHSLKLTTNCLVIFLPIGQEYYCFAFSALQREIQL